MSLRIRYFLLIGFIHILLLVLSFQILEDKKGYFILVEVGIILSFLLSISIYRAFIRPLKFLYSGIDAIEDQDFAVKFIQTGAKEMDQLILTYNKMIDEIRTERQQMEEQHYFLQKIIQASPSGILIFDYDNKLTDFNPKAQCFFDLQESHLQNIQLQNQHSYLKKLASMDAGKSELLMSNGVRQYRCEVSEFVHQGFKRRFVLVQEVSKEILEVEKRAYGKVIRMMAHEVNNSIGAINSILHSVQEFEELSEEEWGQEILEVLRVASERNDRLNQFMKNFANVIRLPKAVIERHSLSKLALEVATLMRAKAVAANIHVEVQRPVEELFAYFDLRQIEQVLVNIIKNAIESIEENGEIQIILKDEPLRLIVRDTGKGIAPEISDKLFTPFFSTKMDGQGVGLTLVREILMQHQFSFSLKTIDENWTEFWISFVSRE